MIYKFLNSYAGKNASILMKQHEEAITICNYAPIIY